MKNNFSFFYQNKNYVEILIPINKNFKGQRLDIFLTRKIQRLSRNRIQRIIKNGFIFINDQQIKKPSYIIRGNENIIFFKLLPKEKKLPEISIIYKDNRYLTVNKPADLTVHPTANTYKRTITEFLKLNFPEYTPAHRLDRETSGVLLCSKKGEVSSAIKQLFFKHKIRKIYSTILKGCLNRKISIQKDIEQDVESPIHIKMKATKISNKVKTTFIPISCSEHATLALAIPLSGKQHQIRVHAESVNHALWGDKIYGVQSDIFLTFIKEGFTDQIKKQILFERQMLHATFLTFENPYSNNKINFYSPIPKDFLKALDFFSLQIPTDFYELVLNVSKSF